MSDFAEDYISASEQNHYNFNPPSIYFVFFDGITDSISGMCMDSFNYKILLIVVINVSFSTFHLQQV